MEKFLYQSINRIVRLFWLIVAFVVRFFVKVNKYQIFCWSYSFDKYGCSPRAFTEYILEKTDNKYKIIWAFTKDFDVSGLDSRIKVVRLGTLEYLIALYTSKFVISNKRSDLMQMFFYKKKSQKYIMMWHGPFALKKIEKDAASQLGPSYVRRAKLDSKMCDLMLSNSKMFTNLIKTSFWYDGEILEGGVPRNDIFYNKQKEVISIQRIKRKYDIEPTKKIILYAPTFRPDMENLTYYEINWDTIIPHFERMLGSSACVFIKLHPNMTRVKGIEKLSNFKNVINVTSEPDVTDLLFAADVMISDYSSTMFDFAMLRKPCFIYAIDSDKYDRGFYFEIKSLPFSFSKNEAELVDNIVNYKNDIYRERLDYFINKIWQLEENGNASKNVYKWIRDHNND